MSPTERAAFITHTLEHSNGLSSKQIADKLNMSASGAHRLMSRISRVLPIAHEAGLWKVLKGGV